MKIVRSLAVAAAAGAMALGVVGTTAASAGTSPAGAQTPGGNAPAASHGPTYLNEHGSGGNSNVVYAPARFFLLGGRSVIYTSPTYWPRWYQNSAVGEGNMWAQRYTFHTAFVGNVTMVFSHRLSNGYFVNTGRTFSYFENVRISGIRPGNGGSVQYWHWSWNKDNWVNNR